MESAEVPVKVDSPRSKQKLTFLMITVVIMFSVVYVYYAHNHRELTIRNLQSSSASLFRLTQQMAFPEQTTSSAADANIMPSYFSPEYSTQPPPSGAPKIFVATRHWVSFFPPIRDCPIYNNCIIVEHHQGAASNSTVDLQEASVVMFQSSFLQDRHMLPNLPWENRSRQLWILKSLESPAYPSNRYPEWINGRFNISMSYRRDSDITIGYQRFKLVKRDTPTPSINYKDRKTRGALAIISNCGSLQYNRLGTIRSLAQYIEVDIFGGCGNPDPCGRMNFACEAKTYRNYHFYLSFENSLCKDYVTEKFWARLESEANLVPVVMGGIEQDEYHNAPPNSYINLYDFDSLEDLGIYLKHLEDNTEEYNSYHQWRQTFFFDKSIPTNKLPTCEICKLANTLPEMKPRQNFVKWWNNACTNFVQNQTTSSIVGAFRP